METNLTIKYIEKKDLYTYSVFQLSLNFFFLSVSFLWATDIKQGLANYNPQVKCNPWPIFAKKGFFF